MYLGAQLAALGSLLIYRNWAALLAVVMFPGLALQAEFVEQWAQ